MVFRYLAYILLSLLMAGLSYVTYLWYRPEPVEQLALVPADAQVVAVVQPRELGVKLITELLFNRDKLDEYFEFEKHRDNKMVVNAGSAGIDPVSPISLYTFSYGGRAYIGGAFHLMNAGNFEHFLTHEAGMKATRDPGCFVGKEWLAGRLENAAFVVWCSEGSIRQEDAGGIFSMILKGDDGTARNMISHRNDMVVNLRLNELGLPIDLNGAESATVSTEFEIGQMSASVKVKGWKGSVPESRTGGFPVDGEGIIANLYVEQMRNGVGEIQNYMHIPDSLADMSVGLFNGNISLNIRSINVEKGDVIIPYMKDGELHFGKKNKQHVIPGFEAWFQLSDESRARSFVDSLTSAGIASKQNSETYVLKTYYQMVPLYLHLQNGWMCLSSSANLSGDFDENRSVNPLFEMRLDLPELLENLTGFYALGKGMLTKFNILHQVDMAYERTSDGELEFTGHVTFLHDDMHSLVVLIRFIAESDQLVSIMDALM
jgi:hypothetical protein